MYSPFQLIKNGQVDNLMKLFQEDVLSYSEKLLKFHSDNV